MQRHIPPEQLSQTTQKLLVGPTVYHPQYCTYDLSETVPWHLLLTQHCNAAPNVLMFLGFASAYLLIALMEYRGCVRE